MLTFLTQDLKSVKHTVEHTFDFLFGFVALDPFDKDLAPFLVPFLATFGAVLDPFVDLETLVVLVALDLFIAANLASFVAAFDPFGAAVDPFGAAVNPFALDSCSARIAKSSCPLEQPVSPKICLMVGEVSSSMVAREELEAIDNRGACDNVMEKAIELFVGTFFLVTYGLSAVLCQRRD